MKKILVTGGAGFIGSNLIEQLLNKGFYVKCIDNLSTGNYKNIKDFDSDNNFEFHESDILNINHLRKVAEGVSYISHQAALGSVPRSIEDPLTSNRVNVEGTLNVFKVSVECNVERVVYAASSSTYGDSKKLPKIEGEIGKPLSPYAVTKLVNELYADVFAGVYGLKTVGLRYFNVFGPKQNPNGPYAAVVPLFIQKFINGEAPTINGSGEQSRDFTYVKNVVQANIKAMETDLDQNQVVINIACGDQTSLNDLFDMLNNLTNSNLRPIHGSERVGDVKHSLADITLARKLINYNPEINFVEGLRHTFEWFKKTNSLGVKAKITGQ